MQFHLAGVLLGLGEFEEGWKRYRWFYDLPDRQNEQVRPIFREWNGEPVAGCRFLLRWRARRLPWQEACTSCVVFPSGGPDFS